MVPGLVRRDRRARVVVDGQLLRPGPADDVLVRHPELAEVHRLRRLDAGHEQLPGPVAPGHVDGQAEVDVAGRDDAGLSVDRCVGVVHLRHGAQRPHHREADEMGERDLAAPAAGQVVVDHDAVVAQQLGRNGPHAGGGGDGEAGGHVVGRARGCAAQPGLSAVHGRGRVRRGARRGRWRWLGHRRRPAHWRRPGRRCGPGRRGGRGGSGGSGGSGVGWHSTGPGGGHRSPGRGLVVGEEVPPRHIDGRGIGQISLIQLIHKPLVRPEIRAR